MQKVLMAGAILVGLAATPAAAKCVLPQIMFDFTNHMSANMEIGSGEYCSGDFKMPNIKIDQAQVVQQPARGLVNIDQKTLVWRYRPFKGFRGQDRFIIRLYGTKREVRSDGTIVFNVTVK
ncbi:MAG: hypothetical protein LCH61_14505 [Proteobacteria bacterium]|nr:hypothetical protein [Pseudomonadota bacterium]